MKKETFAEIRLFLLLVLVIYGLAFLFVVTPPSLR